MSELKHYELTFILGEDASEASAQTKTTELKDFITSLGGKHEKEELWGRRDLAYPIKRNRTGFYVTLWFDLPATQVRPLEEHLRFEEDVIRSLVTAAYMVATPGSLYPVTETDKVETEKSETASAEETLRRSSSKKSAKAEPEPEEDALPEEERLKKLDETLDEMLKEDNE
jgi:small subunit ribosomal protein S6